MEEPQIDEKLYSRQLYALSYETMKKIITTSVLVIGLQGLGIEIVKDLDLAGVKSITLYDDTLVELKDLSSQYYFSIDQVGKVKRSEACIDKVRELNDYVKVDSCTGPLFGGDISLNKYNVVVLANQTFEFSTMVNQYCNENKIHFIHVETRGVFGMIFNDFGTQFQIDDINGEDPLSYAISSVVQDKITIITIVDERKYQFNDGDLVQFKEIMGMTILNNLPPMKIKTISPYSFSIDIDSSEFPCYISGGFVSAIKQSKVLDFKSMNEILKSKENILEIDESKIGQSNNLFIGFQAIHKFNKENGYFPRPHNLQDANRVIEIAKQFNDGDDGKELVLDEKLILQLSYVSQGDISPMQSILGGIASQEVLKAYSGKFEPIHQIAFYSTVECLPNEFESMEQDEFQPIGSRYDGQIITFGKTLHGKIQDLNYFLVGSGSLGCEILKNFAMMGLGTGQNGMIHLTDFDIIKKSNLNSQFLFRTKDLNQLKIEVAGESIVKMNPSVNIKTYNIKVGNDSDSSFGDTFYDSLDGVCNALDTIDARIYMDTQCINYGKPLIDPGTKGTKGSVQVIIPHLTESYTSYRDPPDMAYISHHPFPNSIEHIIRSSLNNFEKLFQDEIGQLISYINEPKYIENLRSQNLYSLFDTLINIKSAILECPLTYNQCITWARLKFQDIFVNEPIQVLTYFPIDQIQRDGTPFWKGPKRIPTPLTFDINNQLHMDFIISASKLRAQNYCIPIDGYDDIGNIKKQLNQVIIPEFIPKEDRYLAITTPTPQSVIDERNKVMVDKCNDILDQIPQPFELTGFKIESIKFEKDDDTHIDFITSNSNLRATIHSFGIEDKLKTKLIAGQIIPILITTTSTIAGYTCIELIKTIQNKPLESYKNTFINLAIQSYNFVEPIRAQVNYIRPDWSYTLWDRFDVEGDITLLEFLDLFESKYKLHVTMLSCQGTLIYSPFTNQKTREERLKTKLSLLYQQLSKKPLPPGKNYIMLDTCCTSIDNDDDDIEIPTIRYKIK